MARMAWTVLTAWTACFRIIFTASTIFLTALKSVAVNVSAAVSFAVYVVASSAITETFYNTA